MASPFAPTPPSYGPSAPTPFGTSAMPARPVSSGRSRGLELARKSLAEQPPILNQTSSHETLLPIKEEDGGGFFGQGFLEGGWDALNYKLLPEWVESGPGPLGTVGGVIRDFSTPFDIGLSAAAAAAAPFTGGGSLIARAAIGGGVKGLGAKGAKFVLAPAVEGGFAKRLVAEGGIGLAAVGAGKAGAHIGEEVGGTPGAIAGGLTAGLAGGFGGVVGMRKLFGVPRNPVGYIPPSEKQVIDSIFRPAEALPGNERRGAYMVGKFAGHYTDSEMKERGLELRHLQDESIEAEPDHGPLSSAVRYTKEIFAGMGSNYDPTTRQGRLTGLFNIFKAREDQAPGLVRQAIEPFVREFHEAFQADDRSVVSIPSLQGELLTPHSHVQLNLRVSDPAEWTADQVDFARLGLQAKDPTPPSPVPTVFTGPQDTPAEIIRSIRVDLPFSGTRPTQSGMGYDPATGLPTGQDTRWYTPPGQIPEKVAQDISISDVFSAHGRDIVVVGMPDGTRQGFYKRTGSGGVQAAGTARPGEWVPFDGITVLQGQGWFNKTRFLKGDPNDPLERYGEEIYADIGRGLNAANLPKGKVVEDSTVNRLIGSAESAESQRNLELYAVGDELNPDIVAAQINRADAHGRAWRSAQPLPSQGAAGEVNPASGRWAEINDLADQAENLVKERDKVRRVIDKLDNNKRLTKADIATLQKHKLDDPNVRMAGNVPTEAEANILSNRFARGSTESRRAAIEQVERELDRSSRGVASAALAKEREVVKELIEAGRRLQDEQVSKLAGGPAATRTSVGSQTMSQVFQDLFNNDLIEGSPGAVKFGTGLFLRAMPDGERYINPRHGFVVTKQQADFVAKFHELITDSSTWLEKVAGLDVPKLMIDLPAGARYGPRVVIDRIVTLAKSKEVSGERPSRPLDTDERFENARFYTDEEVNQAVRSGVVYENDMIAVLATHLSAVYRAGRNEQLKTSLEVGGFQKGTSEGFTLIGKMMDNIDKATTGVAGRAPLTDAEKAAGRRSGLKFDITLEQAEKITGLRGEQGREIVRQVFTLFANAKGKQEASRQSFIGGTDATRTPAAEALRRRKIIGPAAYGHTAESLYNDAGKLPGSDVLETPAAREALRKEAAAIKRQTVDFEGSLFSVNDPIFAGNFYDEQTTNMIRKFTGADQGGWQRSMEFAADAADAGRTIQASSDLSGSFIQGLLLLGVNPVVWTKGTINMVRSLRNPYMLGDYLVANRERIGQYRDLQIANPSEYHRGIAQRGLLGRGLRGFDRVTGLERTPVKPGAAALNILNRFERAFTYYGTYARVELMGAFETLARNPEEFRQAQDIVNKMTGVTSHGAQIIGPKQEHFERTFMFFAPRYTRASLGAVWAVMNPRGGIESSIARDALTKLLIGGTISYVMLSEAIGKEPKLDPKKGDFMTVDINGDRIGIGTVWRSMAKLAAQLAYDPAFQGKLESSPLLFQRTKPGAVSLDERLMDNPLVAWVRGRSSVMTGTAWEIATGADYLGTPIEGPVDISKHLGSNAMPFSIESALLGSPRRTHSGIMLPNQITWSDPLSYVPTGFGAEFMGLRNQPLNFGQERKELRNILAVEKHGVEWSELNKLQQARLTEGSAELTSLDDKAKASRVLRGEEIDREVSAWFEEQERIDIEYEAQIKMGLDALERGHIDHRDFRQNHLAAANQARRIKKEHLNDNPAYSNVREYFQYVSTELPGRNPEQPEDVAYAEFLDTILLNPALNQPTGFDFRTKRRLEHEFEMKWGVDTYNYVRARLAEGKNLHPIVQELLGGQEEFKWYWGSADEPGSINWQIIQNRNNPEVETALFVRWEESTDEEKFALEANSPALRSILRKRSQVRSKVRELDQRLDVFLFRWGYTNSLKHPNHQFDGARSDAKYWKAMETYMLTNSTLDSQQISELGAA